MLLPGAALLLVLNYLPMLGTLIAFKDMKFYSSNIFVNFFQSSWVGFQNFKFFINAPDAFNVTRNTVLYNLVFIVLGLVVSVSCAIALNEMLNKKMAKFYQSAMFLPYFLSWVVVSYLLYALLNPNYGLVNKLILEKLGMPDILWYSTPNAWIFIFPILNIWKYAGYGTVIYFAAICGISAEYYEAASIDGASKWQQIVNITLPGLKNVMIILTILNLGKIFNGDFGLFYQATMHMGNGALNPTGNVLDTYVYNALINLGDIGMASAASLYQAVVGFVMVLASNMIIRKVDEESALF